MRKSHVGTEVFEITDFTNSTEFEEFIYSVEQIIETWGVSKGGFWNSQSLPEFSRSESLVYGRQSFRLTHSTLHVGEKFSPLQQANFPSKTHCLNRWYGLSEFLILSPETTDDAIYFLDSSKLLMSSLAAALTRTQCALPMFIQLGSLSKRFYSGIWLNNSIQTTLEMVLLKSPPPQCSSLKEILCFYKRSIPCSVSPFPQTFISVRYTFCLHNFIGCLSDEHVYPQNDSTLSLKLPFGSIRDPIQDFLLATTWIGLSEHLISDSESGELDPLKASSWSIRYTNTSNSFCVLFNYVDYVASLLANDSTLISLLGTSVDDNIEVDVSSAFRSLTQQPPILQVSSLDITMLPGKLLGTYGTIVDKDIISSYMHYIFETAYCDDSVNKESRSSSIKSCPRDSVTHRIAACLCLVLCNHGGVKGFAQLWRCIVEQLRFHYEKSKIIPGANSQPDPAFSLLHQKIQMLNACVKQKIERESAVYSEGEVQPESIHPALTLLLTGEQLRVPMTQRHPPMTEDMQEEHMEALAKLGSSPEGSRLRAQLHSLSLLSDMQAFKAANSNCRLEDFIRWYSPRDWISVPITRPIIPETTIPDLADEVDREEEDPEVGQTEESTTDEAFANLDSQGNTVDKSRDTGDIGEDDDSSPGADQMEYTDDTSDKAVSSADVEMEVEPHGSEAETADETDSKQDEDMEEKKVDSSEDVVNSDSDDEFVDAEENYSYEPAENSEKSDNAFQSASEASERMASASPTQDIMATEEADEVELERDEGVEEDKEVASKVNTDQPLQNPIKYEQPLDPDVYGGHLSARMAKDSVWKEVWYVAKPIPIWHQKRLFDDTKEAERILHYFIQSQIKTIAVLVMPPLLHAAYDRILECPDSNISFIKDHTDKLYGKLKDLQRYPNDDTEYFHEILSDIYTCELITSKYHSIRNKMSHQAPNVQQGEQPRKMTELERRTRRNLKGPKLSSQQTEQGPGLNQQVSYENVLFEHLITSEAEIVGAARSPWGNVLQRLFHAQQVAASKSSAPPVQARQVPIFPLPIGREYILRTVTKHPSPVSRDCVQRMFVTVSGSEFRMAYANSSDRTFL